MTNNEELPSCCYACSMPDNRPRGCDRTLRVNDSTITVKRCDYLLTNGNCPLKRDPLPPFRLRH